VSYLPNLNPSSGTVIAKGVLTLPTALNNDNLFYDEIRTIESKGWTVAFA